MRNREWPERYVSAPLADDCNYFASTLRWSLLPSGVAIESDT